MARISYIVRGNADVLHCPPATDTTIKQISEEGANIQMLFVAVVFLAGSPSWATVLAVQLE
jgi:hypothetical protein